MIRSGKLALAITIWLISTWAGNAQNLFDAPRSREFAAYLMRTGQYSLAAGEWERVVFLEPGDSLSRLQLVRTYLLAGKLPEAWNRINRFHPTGPLPRPMAKEAIQISLRRQDFSGLESVLQRTPDLGTTEQAEWRLGGWLLSEHPVRERTYPDPTVQGLIADTALWNLYNRSLTAPTKSPGAAVALSVLVPGLGKIYCRDWKDGLMSLVFVGVNAWQSYRGFSRDGIGSVTGWIFGTLALGFYGGNLFGSWKSARDFNHNQYLMIRHEAEDLLYNR